MTVPHDKPSESGNEMNTQSNDHGKISFALKNAKVNEHYAETLQIAGESDTHKISIKGVAFSVDAGLAAQPDNFSIISGVPHKSGEISVTVSYGFQDAKADDQILTSDFVLYINPDPKSLWKNIEPDKNDPYFKDNTDKITLPGSDNNVLLAASRRGRSHEHVGSFRDDDSLIDYAQGWEIIAVADGAGSAKNSRKGSELAVHQSVAFLKAALQTGGARIEIEAATWFAHQNESPYKVKSALYEVLGRAAFAAVKAIEEEAASKNASAKEYATTFMLAVHKKMSFGHFFATYWVGDGAVAVYHKGNYVELLGEVDSGDFAGQTCFLDKQVMTAEDVMKRLRFTVREDFSGMILMTDGVSDPFFETDSNLLKLEKWDALWADIEPLLSDTMTAADKLLSWLTFWSPGNHDDRTIAVLYKPENSFLTTEHTEFTEEQRK
jgi:hypothetical protein